MENEISNPKTEVPTGIALNDKDYLESILTCLKELVKNYATAMTEASNGELYEQYSNAFTSIANMQREVYEVMFENGWYNLTQANNQKIQNKFNTLSKEYQDLNA